MESTHREMRNTLLRLAWKTWIKYSQIMSIKMLMNYGLWSSMTFSRWAMNGSQYPRANRSKARSSGHKIYRRSAVAVCENILTQCLLFHTNLLPAARKTWALSLNLLSPSPQSTESKRHAKRREKENKPSLSGLWLSPEKSQGLSIKPPGANRWILQDGHIQ